MLSGTMSDWTVQSQVWPGRGHVHYSSLLGVGPSWPKAQLRSMDGSARAMWPWNLRRLAQNHRITVSENVSEWCVKTTHAGTVFTATDVPEQWPVPLTIRYDTRCYFNVRSKADISQHNLPHGTDNKKSVKTEKKLKSKKTDMLRSNSKQSGKSI